MYLSIIIHHSLENSKEKNLVQMCRKMRHTYTTAILELRTGVTIVHLASLHWVLCACDDDDDHHHHQIMNYIF